MLFQIKKNPNNTWDLTPCSGEFAGVCVAEAEGIEMANVELGTSNMVGTIKAVWGANIIGEEPYGDPDTIRALCLNRPFKTKAEQAVCKSEHGYLDTMSGRVIKTARQLLVMGAFIYRKG